MTPTESIIKPKRPLFPGWHRIRDVADLPVARMGYPFEVWAHAANRIGVISAMEVAPEPEIEYDGPWWHLSVSRFGDRCSSADALWTLNQFGMPEAREDNHVPNGKVRNFWRPVADHYAGIFCKCVNEPAIREDKGDYVWRAP